MIHVQCRSCYSTLALKEIYAGKLARCPICQSTVRVPKQEEEAEDEAREERVSAAPKSRAPAESRRPRRPVREEDEEERPVRPKRRPIDDDDDDRSEGVQEERPARPSRRPIEEEDDDVHLEVVEEPPPRRRKKKKRRRRRRQESAGWEMPALNWFYIGLAVVALIWLVSLPLAFVFPPIALVPIGLGCLLAFAGWIWFLIVAFQDEIIHGILCLVFTIYNLYYLLINFEETKFPFFVAVLGVLMIMSGCCAGGAFSQHK